jgi:hypothetical protein
VAYLFELYQKLTGELFVDEKKRGKGRKKNWIFFTTNAYLRYAHE